MGVKISQKFGRQFPLKIRRRGRSDSRRDVHVRVNAFAQIGGWPPKKAAFSYVFRGRSPPSFDVNSFINLDFLSVGFLLLGRCRCRYRCKVNVNVNALRYRLLPMFTSRCPPCQRRRSSCGRWHRRRRAGRRPPRRHESRSCS